jgi:hypothetical protein
MIPHSIGSDGFFFSPRARPATRRWPRPAPGLRLRPVAGGPAGGAGGHPAWPGARRSRCRDVVATGSAAARAADAGGRPVNRRDGSDCRPDGRWVTDLRRPNAPARGRGRCEHTGRKRCRHPGRRQQRRRVERQDAGAGRRATSERRGPGYRRHSAAAGPGSPDRRAGASPTPPGRRGSLVAGGQGQRRAVPGGGWAGYGQRRLPWSVNNSSQSSSGL